MSVAVPVCIAVRAARRGSGFCVSSVSCVLKKDYLPQPKVSKRCFCFLFGFVFVFIKGSAQAEDIIRGRDCVPPFSHFRKASLREGKRDAITFANSFGHRKL